MEREREVEREKVVVLYMISLQVFMYVAINSHCSILLTHLMPNRDSCTISSLSFQVLASSLSTHTVGTPV